MNKTINNEELSLYASFLEELKIDALKLDYTKTLEDVKGSFSEKDLFLFNKFGAGNPIHTATARGKINQLYATSVLNGDDFNRPDLIALKEDMLLLGYERVMQIVLKTLRTYDLKKSFSEYFEAGHRGVLKAYEKYQIRGNIEGIRYAAFQTCASVYIFKEIKKLVNEEGYKISLIKTEYETEAVRIMLKAFCHFIAYEKRVPTPKELIPYMESIRNDVPSENVVTRLYYKYVCTNSVKSMQKAVELVKKLKKEEVK